MGCNPPKKVGNPEAIAGDRTLPENLGSLKPGIMYRFFRKSMANRTPLHFRAAVPERDRIQTATQEFIRRYRNNSRDLPACEIETILKEYYRDRRRGEFSQEWVARLHEDGGQ